MNTFFQVSVSIFCIVATIFMLTVFIWTIMLRVQLGKLITKLEDISEVAKTTAGETKDFVERSIKSLESFKKSIFTFEFIRRIVTEIIELIKSNTKGSKNGESK